MNFAKFLRTPFLQNTSGRLLPEKVDLQTRDRWIDKTDNSLKIVLKDGVKFTGQR